MLSVQSNGSPTWSDKINKAFWRGRDSREERLKLVVMAKKNPELFDAALTNFFFFKYDENKYGPKVKHMSFFDFFKVSFNDSCFMNVIFSNSFYMTVTWLTLSAEGPEGFFALDFMWAASSQVWLVIRDSKLKLCLRSIIVSNTRHSVDFFLSLRDCCIVVSWWRIKFRELFSVDSKLFQPSLN